MRIFILLSALLFCCQEGDCTCQNGLSCVLTKNVIERGIENPVKQCMPGDMDIEVETIDLDNQAADAPMKVRRWLYFNVSLKVCWNDWKCLRTDNFSDDGHTILERMGEKRLLGVQINKKLSFTSHISDLCSKASQKSRGPSAVTQFDTL